MHSAYKSSTRIADPGFVTSEVTSSRNLSSTPYYLRNAQSYELQIRQVYSQGPSEQKPVKNLREKGVWAYPGTAQIFSVSPIVSGTRKATNFKFGRYINSVYPTKRLLKIWEKREHWRTPGLPKFLQYPLLSQEHVNLRNSNLAGIFTGSIRAKAF